jgi:hypothetical protein
MRVCEAVHSTSPPTYAVEVQSGVWAWNGCGEWVKRSLKDMDETLEQWSDESTTCCEITVEQLPSVLRIMLKRYGWMLNCPLSQQKFPRNWGGMPCVRMPDS